MTEPIDDTQPHPAEPGTAAKPAAAPDTGTPADTGAGADTGSPADTGAADSPLRVDPDRPSDSGWREPAWFPPRDRSRHRDRRASPFAIAIGLLFIAAGAYYFIDRTLGITLPRIQWDNVWPIALIVIGGLTLVRSFRRGA